MPMEIPRSSSLPPVDTRLLCERLASVRGALGATRLGLARRLTTADALDAAEPFQVLAVVDPEGAMPDPEVQLPAGAFGRLMIDARLLEVTAATDTALGRWLFERGGGCLRGWPLPNDRAVSVMAVAMFGDASPIRPVRATVARAGLDALARALAPPAWAPLARGTSSRIPAGSRPSSEERFAALVASDIVPLRDAVDLMERVMIQRALQCSEGNKAAAARTLQVSRQGLYKKLKRYGLG